jgi:hypothetical protein
MAMRSRMIELMIEKDGARDSVGPGCQRDESPMT